LSVEQIVHC